MPKVRPIYVALLFAGAGLAAPCGQCQEPEKTTVCQLKDDPSKFNHKLLEVSGFVSHGFEDFGLFDPSCDSYPYIWLEYGGTLKSGTMYCCGVTNERSRPQELVVEGISIPLVNDDRFREFDRLLEKPPDSVVHSRIVGRFFAGQPMRYPRKTNWGGYGHFGCCSLLVIERVLSVDPQDREDLDYRASPDQPAADKVGCGYRFLTAFHQDGSLMESQKAADSGREYWAFDDPERVVLEFLAESLNVNRNSINGLKKDSEAQGRIIYKWNPPGKSLSYMVVANRPYWLSFYANDPNRVAWVVLAAFESSCGKHNSVKRIR